jgi:acyl-CoA reductase-like NAD-dependent aldehyde dehydrogenase
VLLRVAKRGVFSVRAWTERGRTRDIARKKSQGPAKVVVRESKPLARRLRAGVVWANTCNRFDPTGPFGGYGKSGFGREGGSQGLAPYLSLA